jgi:hypothetical protein
MAMGCSTPLCSRGNRVSVNAAPGANINGLQSVSATGPSNIWGVGFLNASRCG